MFRYVIICFVGVLVSQAVCAELSDEDKQELRKMVEPVVLACMEEQGIDADEMEELKKKSEIHPCFAACMFRANGIIDNKGMYDHEAAMTVAREVVKNDDILEGTDKVGKICSKVNDEEVRDGDKGCDRAEALIRCYRENKKDIENNE